VRRALPAALAACLALAVAGCGSKGSSSSASSSGTASAASVAPADTPGFLAVNTDFGSDQWQTVDDLLQKFAGRDRLLQAIRNGLQQQAGLDYENDVKPALGPEVDLVWLDFNGGGSDVVALTQPKDDAKFRALVDKANASGSAGGKAVTGKVGDWTIVADSQAKIDQFKSSSGGSSLADNGDFKDALAGLPGDTVGKFYVSGSQAARAFGRRLRPLGVNAGSAAAKVSWIGGALEAQKDGLELEGNEKATGGSAVANFKSKLLGDVPSGALAVLSFRSTGAANAIKQFESSPLVQRELGSIERSLGTSLDSIAGLVGGEGALYVRQGSPIPEITLLLEESDPAQAVATIDRIAERARAATGGAGPTVSTVAGVTVKELSLGRFSLVYAGFGNELVLSTSKNAIADLRSSGGKLKDDADFKAVKDAAGMPDDNGGFLYVNVKDAVEVVKSYLQVAGSSIPPEVDANLQPLQSLLVYGSQNGGTAHFAGFLRIQ
jgi:hypothetical protein